MPYRTRTLKSSMRQMFSVGLFALWVALVGCSSSSAPAIPPTAEDFVKNESGVGTAKVFGIDFRIAADSGGGTAEDKIHANFLDGEQSSASKRFTLGDDVVVQLDSINESEVEFRFNEKDYGTLKVGDQVVIDAEGSVEVNGAARMPIAE